MGQTDHQTSESIVVFTLEGQKFGLDISTVQRVLRAVAVTPLPNAPETVMGLVNVRGAVVPVFDIRRRLGLPEREVRSSDHLIIAEAGRRTVGLPVDAVNSIAAWERKAAVAAKEILPGFECGEGIEGVAKLDGGMIYIYDLAKFLSIAEEASLDAALA
jgi:purine-binding chemotaxis protein CheW